MEPSASIVAVQPDSGGTPRAALVKVRVASSIFVCFQRPQLAAPDRKGALACPLSVE